MMCLSDVKLIALHGTSGVGKDTLVAACKKLPLKVLHLKFATVLRVIVYILNDLDTSKIGDKDYELENGVTQKLIDFNVVYTEVCPELLVLGIKACIYYKRNTPWDVIVVSDLRQPNEYAAIKAMGGTVVRLTRKDVLRPMQSMDNLLDDHAAYPMHLLELLQDMHVNNALSLIKLSTPITLDIKTASSENDEHILICALYDLAERLDPNHFITHSALSLMYTFLDEIYEYTDTLNPCTPSSLL